jgi:hypothetical protein
MNMKKTLTVTLLLTLTLALTACGGDKEETPDPVLCDCAQTYGTTAHLGIDETCDCDADEKPCGCTAKVYGKIADTIPIYRTSGVTDAQATAIAAPDGNIQLAYDDFTSYQNELQTFLNKIDEIHITNSASQNANARILNVVYNAEALDVLLQFYAVATE